ncbi:MAG: hypothetical protein E6Q68_08315 [Polynucleobacter sp.]|nr:MAG: hypothetical protein E6Q68_08315 [Polynucleobacter sp.]
MRRSFLRASLEEDNIGGEVIAVPDSVTEVELSPMEEANDAVETQTLLTEVTADIAEVEQATDVAESLEDLAIIADSDIKAVTPTEAALIETAAGLAAAGTDADPIQVIEGPQSEGTSLESYIGRRLSTEGLKDTIQRIWERIKAVLKKIWEKVEAFFYKIFGQIPRLRKAIEKLKDRIGSETRSVEDKRFTVRSNISLLTVDDVVKKNGKDLATAYAKTSPVFATTFNGVAKNIKEIGKQVNETLGNFDTDAFIENKSTDATTSELQTKLSGVSGGLIAAYTKQTANQTHSRDGYDVSVSESMVGNKSVVATVKQSADAEADPISVFSSSATLRVYVTRSTNSTKELPDTVEFETMNKGDMLALLDSAIAILNPIEAYNRSTALKDIKENQKKISDKTEKIAQTARKYGSDKDSSLDNNRAALLFSSITRLSTMHANLAKSPSADLAALGLSLVRNAMTLCEESLRQYKK